MLSKQDVLFFTPKQPHQFSAIGYLNASFIPDETDEERIFLPGTIVTVEGVVFKASVKKRDWEKIIKRPDFSEKDKFYWRLYFRTNKWGKLININVIQPVINPPLIINVSGETVEEPTDFFQVRGRLEKIFKTAFSVRLERNEKPPKGKENSKMWRPFWVTIQGNLPDDAILEQFWEILCIRDGEYLRLFQATLITEEMVLAHDKNGVGLRDKLVPNSTETTTKKENKTVLVSQDPPPRSTQSTPEISTISQIIMLNGKQAEITVKFTERPDLPEQGKKVTLQITGENGIVVKAEVNRKTLAKQVQKMDTFAEWVAALSGKISEITTDGMVILEGGNVQVFEKKQKVKPEDKQSQKTDSVAEKFQVKN